MSAVPAVDSFGLGWCFRRLRPGSGGGNSYRSLTGLCVCGFGGRGPVAAAVPARRPSWVGRSPAQAAPGRAAPGGGGPRVAAARGGASWVLCPSGRAWWWSWWRRGTSMGYGWPGGPDGSGARSAAIGDPVGAPCLAGRWRVHHGRPVVRDLGSPWQDTVASERTGWRTRAAWLYGEPVFAVDYRICRRCRIGWVESPATDEPYRRCGLAAAGLAALRAERPGLTWHTLGGHFRESRPFWEAIGSGIPGGYRQGPLCPHVDRGWPETAARNAGGTRRVAPRRGQEQPALPPAAPGIRAKPQVRVGDE